MNNCLGCGAFIRTGEFCSPRCRHLRELKLRAISGPSVMEQAAERKSELIDRLVEIWVEEHECPDTCNADPDRMCNECFHPDAMEDLTEEFREKLIKQTYEQLKELYARAGGVDEEAD